MKEELLVKFTDKLLQYAQSAEIFASKNVPLYVEELLRFKMFEHLATFALPLIITIISAIALYLIKRHGDKNGWVGEYSSMKEYYQWSLALVCSIFFIGAVATFSHYGSLLKVVKIKVAPRVYVIDHLRGNK